MPTVRAHQHAVRGLLALGFFLPGAAAALATDGGQAGAAAIVGATALAGAVGAAIGAAEIPTTPGGRSKRSGSRSRSPNRIPHLATTRELRRQARDLGATEDEVDDTCDDDDPRAALLDLLKRCRVRGLFAYATKFGATAAELDKIKRLDEIKATDDLGAIKTRTIELLKSKRKAMKELRAIAKTGGATQEQLAAVSDSEDPQAAMFELLLRGCQDEQSGGGTPASPASPASSGTPGAADTSTLMTPPSEPPSPAQLSDESDGPITLFPEVVHGMAVPDVTMVTAATRPASWQEPSHAVGAGPAAVNPGRLELPADTPPSVPTMDLRAITETIQQNNDGATTSAGQDAIYMAGLTGSGKSTTMSWLAGRRVVKSQTKVTRISKRTGKQSTDYEECILVEDPLTGCEPGDGNDSKTKQVFAHAVGDHVFCDTPGFGDTEGSMIDVANSIATSGTIRACSSVRILLLVDQRMISASRGTHLKEVLKLANRFVSNDHLSSVLVAFTHCENQQLWPLLRGLEKLRDAGHIQEDPGVAQFLDLMLKRLETFEEALMLRPDENSPDELLRILTTDVPPVKDPGTLKSPLSAHAEAELISSLQALELGLNQQLGRYELSSPTFSEKVEVIKTIATALNIDSVASIRHRCADAIVNYCSENIESAKASLATKDIALTRVHFDRLAGFRDHLEFMGVRAADILDAYSGENGLIDSINSLMEDLANIDDSGIEHGLPDFVEIRSRLDVLRSMAQAGPGSLQPFLTGGTRNLYGTAIEKVKRILELVFKTASAKVRAKELDPALDLLLANLAESLNINEHIGSSYNNFYETVKAEANDVVAQSLSELESTLTDLDASRHTQWDLKYQDLLSRNLDLARQAFAHLGDEISTHLIQNHEDRVQQLDLLVNELFTDVDKSLSEFKINSLGISMSNVMLLERLNDGSATVERREAKRDDIESRLRAVIADTKERMKAQLRLDDCVFIVQNLGVLRECSSLRTVVSADVFADFEHQYTNIAADLCARYCGFTKDIDEMLKAEQQPAVSTGIALAVFDRLAQMESVLATTAEEHAPEISTTTEQTITALKAFCRSTVKSCMNLAETAGLQPIQHTHDQLHLLKHFADLFTLHADALPSVAGVFNAHGEDYLSANDAVPFACLGQYLLTVYERCGDRLESMAVSLQSQHADMLDQNEFAGASALTDEVKQRAALCDTHLRHPVFDGAHDLVVQSMKDAMKTADEAVRCALRKDDMETAKQGMDLVEKMLVLRTYIEIDDVHDRLERDFDDKRSNFGIRVLDLMTNEDFETLAKVLRGHAALSSKSDQQDYADAREQVSKRIRMQFEQGVQILDLMRGQKRFENLGTLSTIFSTFEKLQCLSDEVCVGRRVVDWRDELLTKITHQIKQTAQRGICQLTHYRFAGCLTHAQELVQWTVFRPVVAEVASAESDKLATAFQEKVQGVGADIDDAMMKNNYQSLDKILDGLETVDSCEHFTSLANTAEGEFIRQSEYVRNRLDQRCASIKEYIHSGRLMDCNTALAYFETLMRSRHAARLLSKDEITELKEDRRDMTQSLFTERGLCDQPVEKVQSSLREFQAIDSRKFLKQRNLFVDRLKDRHQAMPNLTASSLGGISEYEQAIGKLKIFESVLRPIRDVSELTQMRVNLYVKVATTIKESLRTAKIASKTNKWDSVNTVGEFLKDAVRLLQPVSAEIGESFDDVSFGDAVHRFWSTTGCAVVDDVRAFEDWVDRKFLSFQLLHKELDKVDLADPTSVDIIGLTKLFHDLKNNGSIMEGTMALDLEDSCTITYDEARETLLQKLRVAQTDIVQKAKRMQFDDPLVGTLESFVKLCGIKDKALSDDAKKITDETTAAIKGVLDSVMDNLASQYNQAIKKNAPRAKGDLAGAALQRINKEMEAVKTAQSRLATVLPHLFSVSDQMVRLINAGTERCRDALLSTLQKVSSGPQLYHELVGGLISLYEVPSEISEEEVKKCVKSCIDAVLDDCLRRSRGSGFNFMELGSQLSQVPLGGEIVEHAKQFKAFSTQQMKRNLATMTLSDALAKLQAENGLSDEEVKLLGQAYSVYEAEYTEAIKSRVFYSRDTHALAARYRSETSVPKLIAGILAVWSLDSCEDPGDGSGKMVMYEPHPCQVLTLLSLLRIAHPDGFGNRAFGMMKRAMRMEQLAKMIDSSHLMQLKTGEGKSVILGTLSVLLALRGFDVDCVCYSKYLSERDFDAFAKIFESFGVRKHISYETFRSLSWKMIAAKGDVEELTQRFLQGKLLPALTSRQAAGGRPKILLIDEVDVFFSRDFYGATFKPDAHFVTDSIKVIQKLIWEQRSKPTSDLRALVKQNKAYRQMVAAIGGLSCGAELGHFYDQHVDWMLTDVKEAEGHVGQYQVIDGLIKYKDQDHYTEKIHIGYKTLFCYFLEAQKGNVTPEALNDALGLQIPCGNFSFAEIPKMYTAILGVTGTLESLGQFEQAIVKDEYKVKLQTLAPSIYGDSQLNFKPKDDVQVFPDRPGWYRQLVQECLDNCKTRANLVFFETEAELMAFLASEYAAKIPNLHKVTTATPNIQHYIQQATRVGNTTLFTAVHGRGLDFKVYDDRIQKAGGMHVVQAFLSESLSEEVQIKGRTARMGKKGTYKLVLHAPDLIQKYSVTQAELDDHSKGSTLYDHLHQARTTWFDKDSQERTAEVVLAAAQHADTMRFVDNMLAGQEAPSLQFLTAGVHSGSGGNGGGGGPKNVLFVLDYSGSMRGQRINNCLSSIETIFHQHIGSDDRVALTLFGGSIQNVLPWTEVAGNEPTILQTVRSCNQPNGGTPLWTALDLSADSSGLPSPGESYWIVVLTDGGASDPGQHSEAKRKVALATSQGRLAGLIAITAGSDVPTQTVEPLREMAATNNGELIEAGANVMAAFSRAAQIMSVARSAR